MVYSRQVQLATCRFGWKTGFNKRAGRRIKFGEYDMNRALMFLALAFFWLHDKITPVEMTPTAMTETLVRINIYAETNKAIAPSLDVLAKRDGYVNRTTPVATGRLQYRVAQGGISPHQFRRGWEARRRWGGCRYFRKLSLKKARRESLGRFTDVAR